MTETQWLADRFEEQRPRLRSIAYRMLGSLPDADDALQDAWLRISKAGTDDVENLAGWLTTVVSRICLNTLRARNVRREESLEARMPDPLISANDSLHPEEEALLADSVSLALLVVLDTLTPAERLAFVMHDMFQIPFEDIARLVDRTPEAARQLASRARRRVRGADVPTPDGDLKEQRRVVDAFFAAARSGDLERLMTLLDPDVVLRGDIGRKALVARGADEVARNARQGAFPGAIVRPALVNGVAGAVIFAGGKAVTVMGFTVVGGKILAIDAIADPKRVQRLVPVPFRGTGVI